MLSKCVTSLVKMTQDSFQRSLPQNAFCPTGTCTCAQQPLQMTAQITQVKWTVAGAVNKLKTTDMYPT